MTELIRKVWVQEKVEPLSLAVASDKGEDAFSVRLAALEQKVAELRAKVWVQEALD